jgi:hypothetical protein
MVNKILLSCFFSCISWMVFSHFEIDSSVFDFPFPKKKKPIEINVKKTGPYIGWQKGKYNVAEFGVERQYKKVRLKDPYTNAFHMGFNYNYTHNVLGYDLGYWRQQGRLGLTYGGNVIMRTNFTETRVGLSPVVGFKFLQFHLQTGYQFLTPARTFVETNNFFISLRFVIINNREVEVKNSRFNFFNKDKKKSSKEPEKKKLFK